MTVTTIKVTAQQQLSSSGRGRKELFCLGGLLVVGDLCSERCASVHFSLDDLRIFRQYRGAQKALAAELLRCVTPTPLMWNRNYPSMSQIRLFNLIKKIIKNFLVDIGPITFLCS